MHLVILPIAYELQVDAFLSDSMEKLSRRPKTVEDISTAQREWKECDSHKDSMKSESTLCSELKKLLLQHAPGHQLDTSEVLLQLLTVWLA